MRSLPTSGNDRLPWDCVNTLSAGLRFLLAALLLFCVSISTSHGSTPNIQALQQAAASWKANGDHKRTLPFASHWNTGQKSDGFTPAYQISLLQQGYPILPWVQLPVSGKALGSQYYRNLMGFLSKNQLPFTLVSTQWERVLAEEGSLFNTRNHMKGSRNKAKLTSAGPVEDWFRAGAYWGSNPELQQLMHDYPEPPFIVFLSNNEQRKLRWSQQTNAKDHAIAAGQFRNWSIRYDALFDGFRSALTSPWRAGAVFAGYNNYVPTFMGRWPGWPGYSHMLGDDPNPLIWHWGGSSIPYYLHDWNETNDFSVLSPQVEAMGWYPMMAQLLAQKPNHWFELSVWDGYNERTRNDKRHFYARIGQTFDPARYQGLLRFGLWLTRPRVVREFRHWNQARTPVQPYFQSVLDSTREVHEHPILARFWLEAELVPNNSRNHPYAEKLPVAAQDMSRWFGHSENGIPRNVNKRQLADTRINVFDLVLQIPNTDEYLVFAYSPTGRFTNTRISVEGRFTIRVPVSPSGHFHRVTRNNGSWRVEKLL